MQLCPARSYAQERARLPTDAAVLDECQTFFSSSGRSFLLLGIDIYGDEEHHFFFSPSSSMLVGRGADLEMLRWTATIDGRIYHE